MTPATVSVVAPSPAPVSAPQPNPYSHDEKGGGAPGAGVTPAVDSKANLVDKVSISEELRQTMADVKKEEAKKEAAETVEKSAKPDVATAKVEFVYDLKGELSIRYLDSASRLIYQVPSELVLKLREALENSDTSVDTKA